MISSIIHFLKITSYYILMPKCYSQFNRHIITVSKDTNTFKEAATALTQQCIPLDSDTYALRLQDTKTLSQGKKLHAQMLISGYYQETFLATKLVNMYAMFGVCYNARLVFDNIKKRNVFLWNAMIRGYASNGEYEQAIVLFYKMRSSGVYPDNFTYTFALKACAGLLDIQRGKEIHYWIDRNGIELDVFVGSALVDMYAKCGSMDEAQHVFDKMPHRNVVSWTAMIAGYWQNGLASEAVRIFNEMRIAGVILDSVTLMNVLPACAHLAALQQGKVVHGCIIKNNFSENVSVGTALLDMYAKCGSIEDAQQLFDKMSERDVILWNAMIVGCVQNGDTDKALRLFHQMQLEKVTPNLVTIVSVLPACAHLAALQQGKWMHAYIIRSGFESDVSVGNCLIDMYVKCGNVEVAGQLFERMAQKDVVSWTVMISGYGMHGHVEDALNYFSQMQQTGMKPDHVTFTAVLSACRHAGLLDKGRQYFDSMNQDYCLPPRMEHYACMVDLLGRAGHFDEAQDLMQKMPLQPDNNVFGALLGGCRIHSNIELAEHVSRQLFELDPTNAGNYVLLSNIYAAAGQWHGVAKIRTMLKERGLKKIPGSSWIEIRNSVHAFLGGELGWADGASEVCA